jgi:hypothetical protein
VIVRQATVDNYINAACGKVDRRHQSLKSKQVDFAEGLRSGAALFSRVESCRKGRCWLPEKAEATPPQTESRSHGDKGHAHIDSDCFPPQTHPVPERAMGNSKSHMSSSDEGSLEIGLANFKLLRVVGKGSYGKVAPPSWPPPST